MDIKQTSVQTQSGSFALYSVALFSPDRKSKRLYQIRKVAAHASRSLFSRLLCQPNFTQYISVHVFFLRRRISFRYEWGKHQVVVNSLFHRHLKSRYWGIRNGEEKPIKVHRRRGKGRGIPVHYSLPSTQPWLARKHLEGVPRFSWRQNHGLGMKGAFSNRNGRRQKIWP